jgi:cell wall-associated NlpC family hydrolase
MKRLIFLALFLAVPAFAAQKTIVVIPVADIWSSASDNPAALTDDKRETQVLYGEEVVIRETQDHWARISVPGQPEYSHHQRWEGYPGWVQMNALKTATFPDATAVVLSSWTLAMQPETQPDVWIPSGSFIRSEGKTDNLYVIPTPLGERCVSIDATVPVKPRRSSILMRAGMFLNVPYLWGGLTTYRAPDQSLVNPSLKYGLDCSGLIHLVFRLNGRTIPRDSHEQWMKAKPVKRTLLMPADLIFSAKADQPKKITHVALYAGNAMIIEAPQTGMVVRKISFKEKYGKDLAQVESGDTVGDRVVYFGSLLNTD